MHYHYCIIAYSISSLVFMIYLRVKGWTLLGVNVDKLHAHIQPLNANLKAYDAWNLWTLLASL